MMAKSSLFSSKFGNPPAAARYNGTCGPPFRRRLLYLLSYGRKPIHFKDLEPFPLPVAILAGDPLLGNSVPFFTLL